VSDIVITYSELCRREGTSHQQGLNFCPDGKHSTIFLSLPANESYRDRLRYFETSLVCEGQDAMKGTSCLNPWIVDQALQYPSGLPNQNGKFHAAARGAKLGLQPPQRVRIYERLSIGVWSYSSVFHLIDSWTERGEFRTVYKFELAAVEGDENLETPVRVNAPRRRLISRDVKVQVWQRDGGKCFLCGAADSLRFAHRHTFAMDGTVAKSDTVHLICARHDSVRPSGCAPIEHRSDGHRCADVGQ
jgi:hypothetical protein